MARRLLGSERLAEIHDPRLGVLDLTWDNHHPTDDRRAEVFHTWRPLLAQSMRPELHSCDMLLTDKPAAQRLASAADAALRARHLYTPSDTVHVIEEFVSDNPYDGTTVIVTIRVTESHPVVDGARPTARDQAFTVEENRTTAIPISVSRGGL